MKFRKKAKAGYVIVDVINGSTTVVSSKRERDAELHKLAEDFLDLDKRAGLRVGDGAIAAGALESATREGMRGVFVVRSGGILHLFIGPAEDVAALEDRACFRA